MRTLAVMKHFTFFLAVAEEESFHRAAARLNIAQSALSRRIADLEHELSNTLLFERQARGVKLTEAGRLLLDDVRRILADVDEATRRVARSAEGSLGSLRVSFTEGMVRRTLLPRALKRFRATYPDVDLRFAPMTSETQRDKLRSGEIDVGFVYEEADDRREFSLSEVGVDQIVAVVPTGHALSDRVSLSLGDLGSEPMIWPSRQHAPRLFGRMVSAFDAEEIAPDIAAEVAAVDVAYGLVAAGLGIALVVASKQARPPEDAVLLPIRDLVLPIPLSMVWQKGSQAPVLINFVQTIEAARDEVSDSA